MGLRLSCLFVPSFPLSARLRVQPDCVPAHKFRRADAAERSAQEALLEAADAFSPVVEDSGPGLVLLDVTGERNERALAERLTARAAALGLPACVGLAGTRTAARLAAEASAGEGGAPVVVE